MNTKTAIRSAMENDDVKVLGRNLSQLKGDYAVKYVLEKGNQHTIPSLLKLIKPGKIL